MSGSLRNIAWTPEPIPGVHPDRYVGRPTKRWFQTREKFRRDPRLMEVARSVDNLLLREWDPCDCGERQIQIGGDFWDASVQFPRVDYGRVTWTNKFEPVSCRLGQFEDYCQRWILPASNLPQATQFRDDIIPPWLANIDIDHLYEPDPEFAVFDGGKSDTSVYFIQGMLTGLVKIGIATNVGLRLQSFRTGSTEPLALLATISANAIFEQFLHGVFEPLRHHGEWFYPHWSLYGVIMGMDV